MAEIGDLNGEEVQAIASEGGSSLTGSLQP